MTNTDVVKMVQAGLSEAIVIQAIQIAPEPRFDTSADALVNLKRAGVNERVISTMFDVTAKPAGTRSTESVQAVTPTEGAAQPQKPGALQRMKAKIPGMGGSQSSGALAPTKMFVRGDQRRTWRRQGIRPAT